MLVILIRLLPGLVFLLGFVMYFPADFMVSWDLSNYLAYAKNLVVGNGITDPAGRGVNTRTGFVFLLAALTLGFGKSLLALAVFEALWSATLALTVFLVARALFDIRVALVTILLMLTSPDLLFWLPRHLDQVWPSLLLLSLWFGLRDADIPSVQWLLGIASGLLVLVAFQVKEMAAFFVLVPFLCVWVAPETLRWRWVAGFYVSVLIGGTFIYLQLTDVSNTPSDSLDPSGNYLALLSGVVGEGYLAGVFRLIAYSLQGLGRYLFPSEVGDGLLKYLPLIPFMLIAAASQLWVAVRFNQRVRIAFVVVFVFLPFAALAGQLAMRPSQVLILVLMAYMLLSKALIDWHDRISANGSLAPCALVVLSCAAVVALITYQALNGDRTLGRTLKSNLVTRAILGKTVFAPTARGKVLADWIDANASDEHGIVVAQIAYQHGAYWFLDSATALHQAPFTQIPKSLVQPYWPQATNETQCDVVGIHPWHVEKATPTVFCFDGTRMRQVLLNGDIRLVVLSNLGIDWLIEPWIRQQPDFHHLAEFKDAGFTISVYEHVSDIPQPSRATPVLMDANLIAYLKRVQGLDDGRFNWYKLNLIQLVAGIDDEVLEASIMEQPSDRYRRISRE